MARIAKGGEPVGFLGVDLDGETINVHTCGLAEYESADWDLQYFSMWADYLKKRTE